MCVFSCLLSTKMSSHSMICCNTFISTPPSFLHSSNHLLSLRRRQTVFASNSNSRRVLVNSILKRCQKCGGKGAIECPGCKGTGKNKKNGNIFERWKCFDCQGFGLKSCPNCGKGGLTPEQRGER